MGFVKFNVNGSVKGNPGLAGCGGVLKTSDGSIVALFLGLIGYSDSNMVELMAIKLALEVFVKTKQFRKDQLIIESDSFIATKWVLDLEI
ncbi:hypothetical protein REPUB_Repub10bG0100300 [Reevesia pubescens]